MKVVIIGEVYNADLSVGGGPMPGGPGVMPPIYYPPVGGQPPGIWPPAGVVSPPIYYPPVAGWGPGFPTNPIAPGGPPPVAGWTPPGYHPSHPIAPGGRPPGIWGGAPPYVDIGPPGPQGPNPPVGGYPGYPAPPNVIWPGPGPLPGVSNPIVPPTEAVWVIGYAPGYGATWVQVKPVEPAEPPPEGEQLPESPSQPK